MVGLWPEMCDDVNDSIAARLEVLTTPFGERRLHSDTELSLHGVVGARSGDV